MTEGWHDGPLGMKIFCSPSIPEGEILMVLPTERLPMESDQAFARRLVRDQRAIKIRYLNDSK